MTGSLYHEAKTVLRNVISRKRVEAMLGVLNEHHHPTYWHSLRVGLMCAIIGLEEGLPLEDIDLSCESGILHDIGKTEVPFHLLSKPAKLDPVEFRVVKMHARYGFNMLRNASDPRLPRIVVAHHEFRPGPYPRSEQVSFEGPDRRSPDATVTLLAERVAVADMYDALIKKRVYKPALPREIAERKLRDEFTGNPDLIDIVFANRVD